MGVVDQVQHVITNPKVIDATLGGAAVSSPVWLPSIVLDGLWWYLVALGVGIITLRFLITLREFRGGKSPPLEKDC